MIFNLTGSSRLHSLIVLVIVVILTLFMWWLDPRKEMEQAKKTKKWTRAVYTRAGNLAFKVFCGWSGLYILVCFLVNKPLMKDGLCLLFGVAISGCVNSCYRIFHGVYPHNQEPISFPWQYLLRAACYVFVGIRLTRDLGLIRDGVLTYSVVGFLAGADQIIVFFVCMIVRRQYKHSLINNGSAP